MSIDYYTPEPEPVQLDIEVEALKAERDTLRADNKRLRAALEKIASGPRDADLDYSALFVELKIEARAALAQGGDA